MPELPEVENVRRGLAPLIGETITEVAVLCPRIIRTPSDIDQFIMVLRGETFQDIERRGKYLLFHLDTCTLVSHLRMEGKYRIVPKGATMEPGKHTHVIFKLASGDQLWYHDVRKFGTMDAVPRGKQDELDSLAALGPEPFDETLTPQTFKKKLGRDVAIKKLLLDQSVIAGLGNIYVDESLLAAGIHPLRQGSSLTRTQVDKLLRSIRDILTKAIDAGGATVRSYVNSEGKPGLMQDQLLAYGRNGEPCRFCGLPIEKIVVGGRGTHFCRRCQKPPKGI